MDRNKTGNQYQVIQIVWAALLGTIFIYGFVAYMVTQPYAEADKPDFLRDSPQFLIGLTVMAMVSLLLAQVLPKAIVMGKLKPKLQGSRAEAAGSESTIAESALKAELIKSLTMQDYFAPFIVRLALIESVVIYGLVLAMLSKDMNYYFYFAAPALFFFLKSFPNPENLKKMFTS